MVLKPDTDDFRKCIKAFHADDPDADDSYDDESYFYLKSDVKPDKDYLLTGIWKRSFSEFGKYIGLILNRPGAVIALDDEIKEAVINGYKNLINNGNKRRCCVFYCRDAFKYCYISLRADSSTLGFGFHLTAYCADIEQD